MVILSSGNLGLEIDYGRRKPGDVLHRRVSEHGWRGVYRERKLVTYPFDYEILSAGRYRLRGDSLV